MPITLTQNTPATDLVDSARASLNAELAALDSDVLSALISSASRAIERHCKRVFSVQSYTEYVSGVGYPYDLLRLRQFPVIAVSRVAAYPVGALTVKNTDPTTNQRATIASTSTGLVLVRVASGVTTTSTLAFASYVTLDAMATAINLLGNGWNASASGGYGLYASADLRPVQGAVTALSSGSVLEIYTEDLPAWGAGFGRYDVSFGWIGDGPGWRLDADSGELVGQFPRGQQNIRIDYSAGFQTIPEDVQEACVQHIQDLYQAQQVNSSVSSMTVGPFSYSTNAGSNAGMSPKVMKLLAHYVDHSKLVMSQGT